MRQRTVIGPGAGVVITLDTTPPVATFGVPTGANAGDFFSIPFTLDEPEALSAKLQLGDGRFLDMEIDGGLLTVLLPEDAIDGQAFVRLLVRDDLGNEATRTHLVILSGVIPPPPPQSGLAAGGMPRRPAPRKRTFRSEIRIRTEFTTHVPRRFATNSRILVSSSATISRVAPVPSPRPEPAPKPPPRRLKIATAVTVATNFTSSQPARLTVTSTTRLRVRYTTERDDDGEVARLVALGII